MNNMLLYGAAVVVSVIGFAIYDQRKKTKKTVDPKPQGKNSKDKKGSRPIQEFLPVERVDDGAIVLKGDKYRRMIHVGNINPYALSESEMNSIRNNFRTLLTMLRSPAQFIVRGRRMDLTDYRQYFSKQYTETAQKWENDQILQYGQMIEQHLVDQGNKQRTIRENLFVVGAEPGMLIEHDPDDIKRALQQDIETVVGGLQRCQLTAYPMPEEEQIEALQLFWNKDRLHARARDAVIFDTLRGYHIGEGVR
jgi:hypothetical protein